MQNIYYVNYKNFELDIPQERQERRRVSPLPPAEEFESSGDSGDEFVQEQEKHRIPKKSRPRRDRDADEDDENRAQRKRKRKQLTEQDLEALPPEQGHRFFLHFCSIV